MDPAQLPSTFYRVALKALIFDDQQRLLVSKNEEGAWEVPGGGWEHGESIELGLSRELQEELGLSLQSLGGVRFVFSTINERGWYVARIFYDTVVAPGTPTPGDDMVDFAYVTKEQLLELPFAITDTLIKDYVDLIWPKTTA